MAENEDNEMANSDTESIPLNDEPLLTISQKLKSFFSTHWRGVVCLLAPIVLISILAPFPPEKYQWCAYTLCLMAVYWVAECIPLPITSFLPIVIFPLTSVMTTADTCRCYMNIKAGLGPTITTIIITWLAMSFWAPIVWPTLSEMPAWATD